MNTESPIPGGRLNRGKLVRLGDWVLRPADEDPAIEQLIIKVGRVFAGVPRTFGRDALGRLKLQWIDGEVSKGFDEGEERGRTRLLSVGALLRDLHDSTADIAVQMEPTPFGLSDPSGIREVICHGDPGPGNTVFREDVAYAFIDWELASPGRRAWDLAIALRYWSPFRSPANMKSAHRHLDPWQRAEWLLEGYSVSTDLRLECLRLLPLNQKINAEYIIRRLKSGDQTVYEEWVAKGGLKRLEDDASWFADQNETLMEGRWPK